MATQARRDIDQWRDLASGKAFAMMHKGEIVYGREERDRQSWAAKVTPKLLVINPEELPRRAGADSGASGGASGRPGAVHSPREGIEDIEPKAFYHGEPRKDGPTPLAQLDQCMADLNSNHRKLAQYTEKSIRYLWQETKALLVQQENELKDKLKTIDQLALQNRSLKTENKALSDRLERPSRPPRSAAEPSL